MKVAFFHVNVVFNVPNSLARHASSLKHVNNHYWGLRPFTHLKEFAFIAGKSENQAAKQKSTLFFIDNLIANCIVCIKWPKLNFGL